ncbi:MAG TPA: nuclear transport factor 2 family protein [Acidimicrobiia bacterium]
MGDHPNLAIGKKLMDAFNSGDMEAGSALFSEDVVWHTIGGPTLHGLDQLAASMSGREDFTIETEVHDMLANDDHLIALVEATAKAGEQEFNYRTAEIMHVEDGKITERWAFSDDTTAINEFFGQFS